MCQMIATPDYSYVEDSSYLEANPIQQFVRLRLTVPSSTCIEQYFQPQQQSISGSSSEPLHDSLYSNSTPTSLVEDVTYRSTNDVDQPYVYITTSSPNQVSATSDPTLLGSWDPPSSLEIDELVGWSPSPASATLLTSTPSVGSSSLYPLPQHLTREHHPSPESLDLARIHENLHSQVVITYPPHSYPGP